MKMIFNGAIISYGFDFFNSFFVFFEKNLFIGYQGDGDIKAARRQAAFFGHTEQCEGDLVTGLEFLQFIDKLGEILYGDAVYCCDNIIFFGRGDRQCTA